MQLKAISEYTGCSIDEREELIKTTAQDARNILYFVYQYFLSGIEEPNQCMVTCVRSTNILEFIVHMLTYFSARHDTYSVLLKEQATSLLIQFSCAEQQEEVISKLTGELNLLETLSNLLVTDQDNKTKLNVLWIFSNVMAEPDQSYRNLIIEKTKLIDFLDNISNSIPQTFLYTLPWVLMNLFQGGVTYLTAGE